VVDGESGDSIVDDDEPIQPLQGTQVDDYTDPNWEPEPIDAGPGKVSFFPMSSLIRAIDFRANRPSDVVSTLVSIYDSKDLFVKELQVLLAQRLLAVADGNYEKEVRLCPFIFRDPTPMIRWWTASELGDSQDSVWRSPVASL
jgi:anaphase-promoting complex subunit 2